MQYHFRIHKDQDGLWAECVELPGCMTQAAKKKEPWKGYDFDSMTELTEEQIASLRPVSKSEHKKLSLAVKRHVGRPRKPKAEKEELVSIRFSAIFLQRLKEKARQEGYTAWQTYAKKVLAEHVK